MLFLIWLATEDIHSVIETLNAPHNKIQTLQGEVTKSFSLSGGKPSEKLGSTTMSKFYLKSPNKLVIKCAKPERTIILNDTVLWIYLPVERKAIKKNYKQLSELEKRLIGVESFLGFNPIYGLEGAFEFESEDESTIVGRPKVEGKIISKIVFNIDPQRYIILGVKIFTSNGNLLSSTRYEDWQEIDSIWFPQKLISKTYVTDMGYVKEEGNFRHIKINQGIDESQFNFTPPEGVEVIEE